MFEAESIADGVSQRVRDHDLRSLGCLDQLSGEVDHLAVIVAMQRDGGSRRQADADGRQAG